MFRPVSLLSRGVLALSLSASAAMAQEEVATAAPAEAAPSMETAISPRATFAFSKDTWHKDPKVGWDGFLSGLRGFEHFYNPIGQPIFFETPLNNTGIRAIYLHHTFSDDSTLGGGEVNVAALQVRVALTERLGFIAIKDGYSWLNADVLPEEEGWNEIGAGLKYAFYVDREADLIVTGGARVVLDSGEDKVAMWGTSEISPFVSFAKGWDRFHLIGDVTYRLPFDDGDGNQVFMWDFHTDYEIAPQTLPGLAPTIELHGVHYMSDGERLGLDVGGLDYANFGSSDVDGTAVVWAGFGARWKLNPHTSIGAVYEVSLTDPDEDLMDDRITLDFELQW